MILEKKSLLFRNIYLVTALGLNIAIEKLLMFQLFLSKLKLIVLLM